ncbi:hypothetical protein BC835DRAFT_1377401 [Cytidiella melzeri]|nr:hypothetical protein BC835DRAFT_1377401 [Cytidiella melzeri]
MTEEDSDSQSFQDALQSPYADADTPLPNNTTGESVTVANNKVDAMQSNLTIAPLSSLPLSIPPSKGVPALTLTICVPPTKPTTPSTLHTIPHDVKPPDSPQIPLPTSQHTQLLGAASLGSRPPEVALGAGLPSPVKVPANVKAVSAQETADARRFVHLIRSLDEARLAGNTRVLRTDLAQLLLKRSSNVYKDIGISTFKQYVTLAQTCGIVTVGGTGNSAWVSLQPKWHGHGRP